MSFVMTSFFRSLCRGLTERSQSSSSLTVCFTRVLKTRKGIFGEKDEEYLLHQSRNTVTLGKVRNNLLHIRSRYSYFVWKFFSLPLLCPLRRRRSSVFPQSASLNFCSSERSKFLPTYKILKAELYVTCWGRCGRYFYPWCEYLVCVWWGWEREKNNIFASSFLSFFDFYFFGKQFSWVRKNPNEVRHLFLSIHLEVG